MIPTISNNQRHMDEKGWETKKQKQKKTKKKKNNFRKIQIRKWRGGKKQSYSGIWFQI